MRGSGGKGVEGASGVKGERMGGSKVKGRDWKEGVG